MNNRDNDNNTQTQLQQRGQQQYSKDILNDPIYRIFLNSKKSNNKAIIHSRFKNYYLSRPENINLSLSEVISQSPKAIEYKLIA